MEFQKYDVNEKKKEKKEKKRTKKNKQGRKNYKENTGTKLPWAELPGPSRSGSGTRVVLRGTDSRLGLRFVPFPDPSSSGDEVFGACDCCDLSPPRHSVIWVCTSAPSQADVDRPDPQEVLVSKEACLQFYR